MCKVMMAIKPEYATQILEGNKLFEYRKRKIKRKDVTSIVIYVTSPVKKVLGEVEIKNIIEGTPKKVWDETHEYGYICEKKYYQYFKGKDKAYAYVLGDVHIYTEPKLLSNFNINFYPQSYVYLD